MKKVLKSILVIILVVIIIFLAWKIYLFVKTNIIREKVKEKLSSDFYVKINHYPNEDVAQQYEYWITDLYKKEAAYTQNEQGNLEHTKTTLHDKEKKINTFIYFDKTREEKVANIEYIKEDNYYFWWSMVPCQTQYDRYITNWDYEMLKVLYERDELKNAVVYLFENLFSTIDSIKTEYIDGKECYAIKENFTGTVYYIEKDTYIPVKNVNPNANYTGMEVEYEFSFEPITKEMLDFPNLEEYYVIVE